MKSTTMSLSPALQEIILEAPALISLAAAGKRNKLREAKIVALRLFHTVTFTAPAKLRNKFRRGEPYFEETIDRLDQILPDDPKVRRTVITLWIREIIENADCLSDVERVAWKDILVKFGMYVSRSRENMVEEFFAPITEMFLKKKDGSRWQMLFEAGQ